MWHQSALLINRLHPFKCSIITININPHNYLYPIKMLKMLTYQMFCQPPSRKEPMGQLQHEGSYQIVDKRRNIDQIRPIIYPSWKHVTDLYLIIYVYLSLILLLHILLVFIIADYLSSISYMHTLFIFHHSCQVLQILMTIMGNDKCI